MYLPLDVLVLIAKVDLASYRSMLAAPRFARYTLERNKEFRRHFTVKEVDYYGKTIYTLNGKKHRDNDLPAVIYFDQSMVIVGQEWWQIGKLHRDNDLPAIIYEDGTQEWWRNGLLHRDNDLPAVISADGTQEWCCNGKLHRDNDLPAVISADGTQEWCCNGKLHRDNNLPAIICEDGAKYWYHNGELYHDTAEIHSDDTQGW